MKAIPGGITAAKGFLASGIHCGIKYKNKDLALIYSTRPCVASGVLTQNKVQAAPVKLTKSHLKNQQAQAVIINSGNANCCTGKKGLADAGEMCSALAKRLNINSNEILVASTGIIGQRLAVEKIKRKISLLVKSLSRIGSLACAQAIMTTDTFSKHLAVEIKIGKQPVRIGGIAKGAGMIQPNMATMLAFITTDAYIDKTRLKQALKVAADNSFNLITVEGDTSTNDLAVVLANGLAGNREMSGLDFKIFQQALNFVCLSLAKMIIQDAEGASKFVEIEVVGAKDVSQAKKVAFKIANSPLVKTALFGNNPNWGRIAACVGSADTLIEQNNLNIYLGTSKVMAKGAAVKVDQQRLDRLMEKKQLQIKVDLGLGKCSRRVFTCDLTHKYVKINAEY